MRKRRLGGTNPEASMQPQSQVDNVPKVSVYTDAAQALDRTREGWSKLSGTTEEGVGSQFGELGVITVSYFVALCIFFVDSSSIKSTYTYVLSLTFVSITMSTSLYSGIISSYNKGGSAISKIILVTGGISFLTWLYFSYRLYDDMSTLRSQSGIEEEEES